MGVRAVGCVALLPSAHTQKLDVKTEGRRIIDTVFSLSASLSSCL